MIFLDINPSSMPWMPSNDNIQNWREFSPVDTFRQYQEGTIDAILKGWQSGKKYAIVEAPTGCHARGTSILMFDGTIKKVEDIVSGDLLMGSESTPRTVLELHRGRQEMAKIIPTKGEPFVVNLDHILSLQRTNTNNSDVIGVKRRKDYKGKNPIVNISVKEWLNKSSTFKHTHKLYYTGITFQEQQNELKIPPYILGIWLGNGISRTAGISNVANEVIDAWSLFAEQNECKISITDKEKTALTYLITSNYNNSKESKPNPVITLFRDLNLLNNKHIPFSYLVSSRKDRLELLAGLLDTDGCLNKGCFEFTQKRKHISEATVFLARSLGFAAYLTETKNKSQNGTWGTYYRVCISGAISEIPNKVKYKKAEDRQQKKSVNRTGFKVDLLPEDDYFGFTVDGDNLYVMGNFIVTHNSGKSIYSLALGKLFGTAFLCTPQKMLQNQYMNDFGDHLYELKGRATYPCLRINYTEWEKDEDPKQGFDYISLDTFDSLPESHPWKRYNCANAPCKTHTKGYKIQAECKKYGVCEYIRRRDFALTIAPFSLLNFSNMILFTKLILKNVYNKRPLLIMDEVHSIESFLYNFDTITLTVKILKPLHIHMENEDDLTRITKPFSSVLDMVEYIETILFPAFEKYLLSNQTEDQVDDEDDDDDDDDPKEDSKRIRNLFARLKQFVANEPTNRSHVLVPEMVYEARENVCVGYKIKPFSVAHLNHLAFGASNSRVLLMSATILDPVTFCNSVGIPIQEAFFISVGSTFPAKNRQIILDTTVGSMAYKHKEKTLPKMMDKIHLLLDKHSTHKGIIHTGNYENMNYLMKWVKDYPELKDRILFQAQRTFIEKERILQIHSESQDATVICGPGFLEGLDLKDNLARFNIIMKLPYLSLADPLVKRKSEEFPEWYDLQVALALIQAIGRTVRSPIDWSLIYILDLLGKVFYEKHKNRLFPKYIQEAVKIVT